MKCIVCVKSLDISKLFLDWVDADEQDNLELIVSLNCSNCNSTYNVLLDVSVIKSNIGGKILKERKPKI